MGNNEETWMTDQFGRDITYLRISVTELCNLRCRYCMPEEGVCKKSHADMLTEDEMIQAVEAAASLGITKLRITGGEPLVKKNIVSICRRAAAVDGIRGRSLIINLPGSKKASAENLLAVIDSVAHGLDMLYSEGSADCGNG